MELSVGPGDLRLRDAFELLLQVQVRLELGEHPEHVENRLAGWRKPRCTAQSVQRRRFASASAFASSG
jgi:hypothetical protein